MDEFNGIAAVAWTGRGGNGDKSVSLPSALYERHHFYLMTPEKTASSIISVRTSTLCSVAYVLCKKNHSGLRTRTRLRILIVFDHLLAALVEWPPRHDDSSSAPLCNHRIEDHPSCRLKCDFVRR